MFQGHLEAAFNDPIISQDLANAVIASIKAGSSANLKQAWDRVDGPVKARAEPDECESQIVRGYLRHNGRDHCEIGPSDISPEEKLEVVRQMLSEVSGRREAARDAFAGGMSIEDVAIEVDLSPSPVAALVIGSFEE